jgi:hypothetical protein
MNWSTLAGPGASFYVTVYKDPVVCRTARPVLRDFLNGKGTRHGPANGPLADQYWTLDGGWRCGHGAGGGACIHGGSNYKLARDFIEADSAPAGRRRGSAGARRSRGLSHTRRIGTARV